MATCGLLEATPIRYENVQSLDHAGVLCLLPSLIAQGLFSYQSHYRPLAAGYYDLNTIILLLAYLFLCRIKNAEQLKHHSPGELGKLLGIDRVPEAKCLRSKVRQITGQQKAEAWNSQLATTWAADEENTVYYVDGHVQVYHGHKARLGKKHVARQKLCLPGMCEFWVNNRNGDPYFVVTGQVNEKLQQALTEQIIPKLLETVAPKTDLRKLEENPLLPRLTLVFDREAYSPKLFKKLWDHHRIAVLTYRKNVKDTWDKAGFQDCETTDDHGHKTTMSLCEKQLTIDGAKMREIRKRSEDGHQTSIVTTNYILPISKVATDLFSRWSQENYFRYMRQDYDLDRITQYTVEALEENFTVRNPEYNKASYQIKQIQEKTNRRMAMLYQLAEKESQQTLDKIAVKKQIKITEQLTELKEQQALVREQRSKVPCTIKIKDMPPDLRYNKLNSESKLFYNTIKMICYRSETTFSQLLAINYKKKKNEVRSLAKQLIKNKGDLIVDQQQKTLTVKLYSMATPRDNKAVEQMCQLLTETETICPGTELRLIYQITTA